MRRRITVLANGCFDVLHVGHIRHLQKARGLGDRLVVALTRDAYVNKGPNRPFNPWDDRAVVLASLECVDEVIPSRSAVEAILRVRPQIFVKGIDYLGPGKLALEASACAEVGAKLCVTRTPKFSFDLIVKKICRIAISEAALAGKPSDAHGSSILMKRIQESMK